MYNALTGECKVIFTGHSSTQVNDYNGILIQFLIVPPDSDRCIYVLSQNNLFCEYVIFDDIQNICICSNGNIVFVFKDGSINLFVRNRLEGIHKNILYIDTLPDNRVCFISNDFKLWVGDFNTHKCTLMCEVNKSMKDTEMTINLKINSQYLYFTIKHLNLIV